MELHCQAGDLSNPLCGLRHPENDLIEQQVTREQVVDENAIGEQLPLSDAQFANAIARIEKLIDENRLDEAKRQLHELQQLCPVCEFPESVKGLTE